MIMKWMKNKMHKMMIEMFDENRDALIEEIEQIAKVPDVSDIVDNIDMGELIEQVVHEIDVSDVADDLSISDIAHEIDVCAIAEYIEIDVNDIEVDYDDLASCIDTTEVAQCIELDYGDIEVDYTELAYHVAQDLDLEEIARHADVDSTIFTHIHMLQTRLEALIAVVNDSAMNTIDLMTFNKALEGEE
mgnify:CR=1 FL=1